MPPLQFQQKARTRKEKRYPMKKKRQNDTGNKQSGQDFPKE